MQTDSKFWVLRALIKLSLVQVTRNVWSQERNWADGTPNPLITHTYRDRKLGCSLHQGIDLATLFLSSSVFCGAINYWGLRKGIRVLLCFDRIIYSTIFFVSHSFLSVIEKGYKIMYLPSSVIFAFYLTKSLSAAVAGKSVFNKNIFHKQQHNDISRNN